MIEALQNRTMAAEVSGASDGASARRNERPDFRELFRNNAARSRTRSGENAAARAVETPASPAAAALPAASDQPASFAISAIEANLNRWLMQMIEWQNQQTMQTYNQAVENWKLNSAQHRALGLPELPPPEPPVLQPVEPKPPGWWSEIHS